MPQMKGMELRVRAVYNRGYPYRFAKKQEIMMKLSRVALLVALVAFSTMTASADSINIFNTGVSSTNTLLAAGAVDPHYSITTNLVSGNSAFVASNTVYPLPSPWVPQGPNSQWIAPSLDTSGPVGNYTYTTTFDLTGLNPATAILNGNWTTDNNGGNIILNGNNLGFTTSFTSFFAFNNLFSATSGFVPGINTLQFVVTNGACGGCFNPTGLRVEVSGTAAPVNPVPEPATLLLVGSGLVGVWLRRRS
jgi:hypothetical protein